MYQDFYGFSDSPFGLTPDLKYYFRSASHANAFELVLYAIRRGEGFVAITGDAGTGKTSLSRALLEHLDRTTLAALIPNPSLSEDEILRVLLQEFGVVSRERLKRGDLASVTRQALMDTLHEFLRSLQPIGARALLVIDDAQNLPLAVLEQIRFLSDLEAHNRKLLQVVLVGQAGLTGTLAKPELRQLAQRISVKHELKPLSRAETGAYIAHRLRIAGGENAVSFSPGSIGRILGCTRGVPRLVNVLCDRALFAACSDGTTRVLSGHVERAAEALDLAHPGRLLLAWAR